MFKQFTSSKLVERKRGKNEKLLQFATDNREEGYFDDVIIVAGNNEIAIPANRMVLSCYCPFFEKMFRSSLKEQFEHVVQVKGVEGKIMKTIIDFLYTGNITISEENVADLLPALDYLLLEEPKEFCFIFLNSILSPQNSLYILHVATLYRSFPATISEIYSYISYNFVEVSQTDDFLALSSEMLQAYLPNIDRNLVNEASICKAIMRWSKYDKSKRQIQFSHLFKQLIMLDRLSHQFIRHLQNKKLIKKNAASFELVAAANEKKSTIKARSYKKPKAILCLGGARTPNKIADVFNLSGKTLLTYPDLPENLSEIHAMKLKNVVYCVGKILFGMLKENICCPGRITLNKYDYSIVNKVYRMNFKDGILKWEELAPCNSARGSFGATEYEGLIVISGGRKRCATGTIMNSVEVYEVGLNQWRGHMPMNEIREGHELVVCAGCLYALGGSNSIWVVSTVERLRSSDILEKWVKVQPMQEPRHIFAAVSCNNYIYAIGGSCGNYKWSHLKSVEKYNPFTNQWVYVNKMNRARTHHSACVINDRIYVVGGFDEKSNRIQEIECYDPATNKWTIVGKTNDSLTDHALIAV